MDDPFNWETDANEELVVEVELPPGMAEMDMDGVAVVEEEVEPEEEETLLWWLLLLLIVDGVVAADGAAGVDELEEFSNRSCWTWRISTYSSRLALALERLFIPVP